MRSPYEILNVPADATPEQIRSAYQSWAKLVHPDRVEDSLKEFATGLMQDINGAYQALTSGQKGSDAFGQDSVEQYLNFLRNEMDVHQDGDSCQLTLPYWSLPSTAFSSENQEDEPFLNLYIKPGANNGFTITDRGENLKCLANFGHEVDLAQAKEIIKGSFPVTERSDIIGIRSQDCPSIGEAIDMMAIAIVKLDNMFDERIHNWYQAQDFVRQRNEVALISGYLTDQDYDQEIVYQSQPFTMNREGQGLHLLLIPDPFWVMGEVKLVRVDDPILSKHNTVFESRGFSSYEYTLTATKESYEVPEVGKYYRITVSGKGGFLLAAYKTM